MNKERPKKPRFTVKTADTLYVLRILQLDKITGNERYVLRHLIKLLIDRNDMERLLELANLFYKIHPVVTEIQLTKFYYWYKSEHITIEDVVVYNNYMCHVTKYGITECNPSVFAERGTALLMWLLSWLGDSGNDLQETLNQYFKLVLPEVIKFNRNLLNTPKSILEGYGRNIFLTAIENNGGKKSFIKPTSKTIRKNTAERTKLETISNYRQRLLEKGDLKKYDKIGRDLAIHGIDEVYKDLQT